MPRADRWTQAAWTAAAVGFGSMALFLVLAAATDGGVRGPVFAVLIAAGLAVVASRWWPCSAASRAGDPCETC